MHRLTVFSLSLVLASASLACSGPGSPSGPLDAGGFGDSPGSSNDVAVSPVFDAPVVGPLDAFALDEAGNTTTCTALQAYAKCNSSADPCAVFDLKDCTAFDAMYNLAGRQAVTTCYNAGCGEEAGTVSACVYGAATTATPGSAQTTLATHYCQACASDASAACESAFYNSVPNDGGGGIGLGVVLELAIISDATLQQIDSTCVAQASQAGSGCADAFGQCAGSVLALSPGQCGESSSDGGDDGGDASDPGGA